MHEEVQLAEPLEQGRELVLGAAEVERPPVPELGGDQPAWLRAGRNAGSALAFVERPGVVGAADLAREVDRVQVAGGVRVQSLEEEGRREAVGDAGLHRDGRPQGAHDRVQVGALGVADRAERELLAAPLDRGLVLASALEQMLPQPRLAELPLVADELGVLAAQEALDELAPDPPRIGEASRMARDARRAVELSLEGRDRHGRRTISLAPWTPASSTSP